MDFKPKPPKIRTRVVSVPIKAVRTPTSRIASSAPPSDRYKLSNAGNPRMATSTRRSEPLRKSSSTSRTLGKRRNIPSPPHFDESSSDEASEDSSHLLGVSKRQKTSNSIEPISQNRCLEPDPKRHIRIYEGQERIVRPDSASKAKDDIEPARLTPGVDLTRGQWAKDYKPAFSADDAESNRVVELQYPSPARPEQFELVVPRSDKGDEYNPLEDIYSNIEEIIQHYLPAPLVEQHKLSDEAVGIVRLLKRAVTKDSPSNFRAALTRFNAIVKDNMNGISTVIDDMHAIPLGLVQRIINQVYQRTVSWRSHRLRRVTDRKNTYGELLPHFVHTMFQITGLNSQHVFVDLGSGVGNVVLQSALQTGAESHGIEILQLPAECALDQASELRARAKLWNISLGPITLLQGDFLESPHIDAVLRRADVVLVNNKVFPTRVNNALLDKFLDLKRGCKVISLESFGGGAAGRMGVRNENSIANLFDEERRESGTNSVSWGSQSVEYFIATKTR
ncbi:DOT1-domain-containing protein [Byssothecium circinans]|uniref:Histone-lysine N-methyltransferase, H3 lysine-79 specific n=1 Tax=Byssothecium circinans TaxID=147558 RepID=A0A6A5T8X1_9PLEO|nr:DOT1-domain-containing protein [Byssothecium circinans]